MVFKPFDHLIIERISRVFVSRLNIYCILIKKIVNNKILVLLIFSWKYIFWKRDPLLLATFNWRYTLTQKSNYSNLKITIRNKFALDLPSKQSAYFDTTFFKFSNTPLQRLFSSLVIARKIFAPISLMIHWKILRYSGFSKKLYNSNLSGYKLSEADYKIFSKIAFPSRQLHVQS